MTTVLCLSPLVAGSRFANAINTVKMADGFAELGCETTLVCCRRFRALPDSEFRHIYGIGNRLAIVQLPWIGKEHVVYALAALNYVRKVKPDVVFARTYIAPVLTAMMGIRTIAETHAHVGARSLSFLTMLKATRLPDFLGMVTIGAALKEDYCRRGVPAHKILVLPTGVNVGAFRRPAELPPSPFPKGRAIACYVGHLYDYKGLPEILEAARLLPEVNFHIVGGENRDIARQLARAQKLHLGNVFFHGFVPQRALGPYLWSADVVLLPPSDRHPSAGWTSPVKLGEYLASGTPLVASAIPALRHWLDERVATFVRAGDATDLAAGIRAVLADKAGSAAKALAGCELAQDWSYLARARRILSLAGVGCT